MKKIIFTLTLILGFISAQANFDNYGPDSLCSVTIDTIQNGACLQANPTGTAPFTYEWSDSTFSSSTCINAIFNTYCVTVTDAAGCVAVACSGNTAPICNVWIDVIPDTSGYTLTANSSGTPGYTYIWSTGNFTTQSINTPVSGTFCVTVTDADGCAESSCATVVVNPPSNCSVIISPVIGTTCLEAIPTGTAPFTYYWSDGVIGGTNCNTVPSDSTCVTVTDANGCVATACVLGSGPDCAVVINQNGNSISANATSNNPNQVISYTWSTGENTQIITPPGDGDYCVTISDGNGCTADDCYYFYADTSGTCEVSIYLVGSDLYSYASSPNSNQFTYLWSTGATTTSIGPLSAGTYCLTVTDGTGCTVSTCYTIAAQDIIEGYILLDSISSGGGWINNGFNTFKVYLIEHDVTAGSLTAIDSQLVTSTPNNWGGFYSFSGVANGDYLVKAAIEVGSDQYDNYLPTYFVDVLYWNDATTVTVPGNVGALYNIDMVSGTNPGGPGFIGGLIIDGANLTSGQVEVRGDGDPLENVSILLLTENDMPITHTVSNAQGEFEFSNLAWGTYKVVVEVLGKEQGIKFITIGPDNQSGFVNFEVNETYVTRIEDVLNGASLKVFPNPVDDNMNIQIEIRQNTNLNISVNNLLGKTIFLENKDLNEGIQTMNINLRNLPSGIYFLNLSDGQEIISHKIMKR
ncbi:MAG: T9SS type A sorting domain-containing protein [Saprospiraceae bacterium]